MRSRTNEAESAAARVQECSESLRIVVPQGGSNSVSDVKPYSGILIFENELQSVTTDDKMREAVRGVNGEIWAGGKIH